MMVCDQIVSALRSHPMMKQNERMSYLPSVPYGPPVLSPNFKKKLRLALSRRKAPFRPGVFLDRLK